MRTKNQNRQIKLQRWQHRALAYLLVVCLLLSYLNLDLMVSYATGNQAVTFEIGENVTAVLEDGVLTLSGMGDTADYTAETAPFLEYAAEVQSLVIEGGITRIGDYLFYGLGQLEGELMLPESIVSFGQYAFSGEDLEHAPKFTVIRNLFESGEVTGKRPKDLDKITATPSNQTRVLATASVSSYSFYEGNDDISRATPANGSHRYTVESIIQQEVADTETLFFYGQSGIVVCSDENTPFIEAAIVAGYQVADGTVTVTLDDLVEMELPAVNGQICLPGCPAEISSPYEEDVFFSYKFIGWTAMPSDATPSDATPSDATPSDATPSDTSLPDAAAPLLAEGEFLEVQENQSISLYSAWKSESKYQLKVKTELKEKEAVYSLIDGKTDDAVSIPAGYAFLYQWQSGVKSSGDAVEWVDIDRADDSIYVRTIEPDDNIRQFRCKVTPVRLARTRTAGEQIQLFSEPVDGVAETITVYVDQTNGNDESGDGTESAPYKTIDKAAGKLKTRTDGGSVESNRIVIMGEYQLSNDLLKGNPVPVTITGTAGASLKGQGTLTDMPLYLYEDFWLESIKTESLNHIYGNGFNITIGENVANTNPFYLYGAGNNQLINNSVGKITVKSGNVSRIVGYVRSRETLDAQNIEANITIEGGMVGTIIAGSASGKIINGNVVINVTGGTVQSLSGGNQGFNNGDASFSGNTDINISGGTVGNVYGAGTGRNVSIPSYTGNLNIHVTGGTVSNIYGAGSAAFIKNEAGNEVNISVVNSRVGNIFAAGRGGDSGVKIDSTYTAFPTTTPPEIFGSLNGTANITVGAGAEIANIYAGGQGYAPVAVNKYTSEENACLNGKVKITLQEDCLITGNVYGGGMGVVGTPNRGAIKKDSAVDIFVEGGTVRGSVFGGGALAKAEAGAAVKVHMSGGTVDGNVYGGGEKGLIEGKTEVDISGGTIKGSVYGGALGEANQRLVLDGSTTNVTGGWIQKNLYGGSEFSNDGPEPAADNQTIDRIFVNLAGGTVSGNVFGGGYQGKVTGSTHLHIGISALGDCKHYQAYPHEIPVLKSSPLSVGGSVYAGGDYGGKGEIKYDTITVTGTSHVYIDGTGYCTDNTSSGDPVMTLGGGVFGSGASCDAGSTRIVTLENYGAKIMDTGNVTPIGTTRKLNAIQRADRVVLNNSHVQLTGQSDMANSSQTELYSLNRIGNHGLMGEAENPQNALVLKDGSTLVIDSEINETANFVSETKDGKIVDLNGLNTCPNTIRFNHGTEFRLFYTDRTSKAEKYGAVKGYAYMAADKTADAYAYARQKTNELNNQDGGFADPADSTKELSYKNVAGTEYRYWRVRGADAKAERYTVLTAQTLAATDEGYGSDGYSVVMSSLDLPQAEAGTVYTISRVDVPTGLTLVDAAKNTLSGNTWITSDQNVENGTAIVLDDEKNKIKTSRLNTFGLYIQTEDGFSKDGGATKKILSNRTAVKDGTNSIIGQTTVKTTGDALPQLNFYLTYGNDITVSKELGTVKLLLESKNAQGDVESNITVNVEIVTKASALADQTLDLYATQGGSYTGQLIIPVGDNRNLTLKGVAGSANLVSSSSGTYEDGKFSITMMPEQSSGWRSIDLSEAYDLKSYIGGSQPIGSTDGRYQAPINFTLRNKSNFASKPDDTVTLTLSDGTASAKITIAIHWTDSVVSSLKVGEGRQYNGVTGQSDTVISKKSAVTAAFTLGSAEPASALWLELRAKSPSSGKTENVLPSGGKLTLLLLGDFYSYTITGNETDKKIILSEFKAMKNSNTSVGADTTIPKDTELTIVADFSEVSELPEAYYSLRLRSNDTADSQGADFTIDNSAVSVNVSGGDGKDKGIHTFNLQVAQGSDTRMKDGVWAVLSPESNGEFPEGTFFTYGGNTYYPGNNRVFLPLKGPGQAFEVVMDTTKSQGLTPGNHEIRVDLYPAGYSAGETTAAVASNSAAYSVTASPSYGIHVKLAGGGNRVIETPSDTALNFEVSYTVLNMESPVKITVSEQIKGADGMYTAVSPAWPAGEIQQITTSGTGIIPVQVTVPKNTAPGTYRLIFTLGDQNVPYNIIVK